MLNRSTHLGPGGKEKIHAVRARLNVDTVAVRPVLDDQLLQVEERLIKEIISTGDKHRYHLKYPPFSALILL